VTVTDGETALLRLKDLAPDLVMADVSLPSRSGYEICEYVKTSGKYPQTRVLLTAGPVAAFDESRAHAAGSDGFVRKPFEASVLLNTVQPLIEKPGSNVPPPRAPEVKPAAAPVASAQPAPPRPVDREQVRAAVILALEASLITMIENITDKVVIALEAEARTAAPAPAKAAAADTWVATASAGPGAPPARPEAPKSQPAAAPDEPVVRIRTPVFRTLS